MEKIKQYFSDWTFLEKSWLIISSILIVSLSLYSKDSGVAIFSSLSGIISVVLCAKGKIENYIFGLFNAITYAYLCYQGHIYGEVMYNILMVPMIIIGFISWKKNMSETKDEVKTRNLSIKGWIVLIVISILSVIAYSTILKIIGGRFALVDATSTTLSIIATVLMLMRYSEQWLLWVAVNIVSVLLWFMALKSGTSGSITLLVMWSAYLFNSVYGYINWRKMTQN